MKRDRLPCAPCIEWLQRHRRMLLWLALLWAGLFALGYFSNPVVMPNACKIYG